MGDLVVEGSFNFPWIEEVTFDLTPETGTQAAAGLMLQKIPPALCFITPPTSILGAVGQTGLTAFFGIERLAATHGLHLGDVVVVSAAAGAVGSVACALARRRGCTVIGVCGSDDKAAWLMEQQLCSQALNYRHANFGPARSSPNDRLPCIPLR